MGSVFRPVPVRHRVSSRVKGPRVDRRPEFRQSGASYPLSGRVERVGLGVGWVGPCLPKKREVERQDRSEISGDLYSVTGLGWLVFGDIPGLFFLSLTRP